MSENIPESIPTSHDHRSHRPAKKARAGPPTLKSTQSSAIEALFAKQPDIQLPTTALARTAASLAPPPEIVANVQGSSAGAGSGEFHVYKASRRREYERIKLMEEEAQAEEDNRRWAAERAERERRDAEKGGKNKRRREKAKARKEGKGVVGGEKGSGGAAVDGVGLKGPNPLVAKKTGDDAEEQAGVVADEGGIIIHDDD